MHRAHRWLPALAGLIATLAMAAPAQASGSGTSDAFEAGLSGLVAQIGSGAAPAAVHQTKAALIAAAFTDQVNGLPAARVITDLDCISRNLQQARDTLNRTTIRARFKAASSCRADLAKLAGAAHATGLAGDAARLAPSLKDLGARAVANRAYGSRATALRKLQSSIVAKRFAGQTLHGVPFGEVYDDVECVDVKIEAKHASGASSCAKRLLRLAKVGAPIKTPITFGSDLTGTPVALPDAFAPDDTEFWTAAQTVPADGLITSFSLKTGDSPVDLPLRFSVVRPNADGTVTVITTTNPVYPLAAHQTGVHVYPTAGLSFTCCKVQKGDIVTVDNSGSTTPGAYVWFAASPGATTFSHTSNGLSQNAGVVWQPITHPGYETLVQVTMTPS